ncbi:hypothetical protein SLE2022_380520 [Rubroshorea leprosula]
MASSKTIASKKPTAMQPQAPYNSLYVNPLTDLKHNRSCSEGNNKENVCFDDVDKENAAPVPNGTSPVPCRKTPHFKSLSTIGSFHSSKEASPFKSLSTGRVLKPSSLQFCMQRNEPEKVFGYKLWDPVPTESDTSSSLNVWDFSDSEAAPASSWFTLPNRALLYRPLPPDIGRCTCVIVKESSAEGLDGGTLYSLYTNEGKGRQDRKLAVAYHKRRNGKSEFIIAQNTKGILSISDDSYVGLVTANLIGSKYHIWDQGSLANSKKQSNSLLGVIVFMPTIATWTGSYRSMKAYVPRHQSMQLKCLTQRQHINGLPKDWEKNMDNVHKLFSKVPHYNNISKQYELDYRDKGRIGLRIQSSVKNFQLTLENGRQTVLQLGRVDKYKYVMDFRYPLTGYQAFCICLASIDPKLCCTV